MDKCPHCNSSDGYYVKVKMYGAGVYNYTFDGRDHEENSAIHDGMHYRMGKIAYCMQCNKRLFEVQP